MQDSSAQTASNKETLARLKAMRKMLAEPVHEWTAAWVEHGREQGIQQGQRELLSRQAARKFSTAAGERLAAVLAGVAELDQLEQVGDWIIDCETAAALFARFQGGSMLAETVQEWTAEWVEQGREQGSQQGRRALLGRQAARKFDAAAGERLAAALAGVADPDRLEQVGDWIIECETAAELFARFQDGSL